MWLLSQREAQHLFTGASITVMSQHINHIKVLHLAVLYSSMSLRVWWCQKFIIPLMCFETKAEQQLEMPLIAVQSYIALSHSLSYFRYVCLYRKCKPIHVHITMEQTVLRTFLSQFSQNSFNLNAISVSVYVCLLSLYVFSVLRSR